MSDFKRILYYTAVTMQLASTNYMISYENDVNHYAQEWTNKYIVPSTKQDIETIVDLFILSHEIIKESCSMIIAKLTMQQELYKIYTPSFIDSWHENLQINYNDTTTLEKALATIKQSQANLQNVYTNFKTLIPYILQMSPQPTQTLIIDLKNSLLAWGKHQQFLTTQLLAVQDEFAHAIMTISDIKNLFETVSQSQEVKHGHLKDAASFYAKTYKEIDQVNNHLTTVRISGILKIQEFFTYFFKTYYTTLYNQLSRDQQEALSGWALQTGKNIDPDDLFI